MVTTIELIELKLDKAFRISSIASYDGPDQLSDNWAELIGINGLISAVSVSIEFKLINSIVGCWSVMQFIGVFVKLFVEMLISETSVGEICVKEFNVELFGNYMKSNGQCFREPFSSLQFGMPNVNLNLMQAELCSSNKGGFTYDLCLKNWIECTSANAPKLSVRQAIKGPGKSEALIFDHETNFQLRVSYLEKGYCSSQKQFWLIFCKVSFFPHYFNG